MNWTILTHNEQLHELLTASFSTPCVIFKHSPRCSKSAMMHYVLEAEWQQLPPSVRPYLVDVVTHPYIARYIAETLNEYHESPQLLLIQNGECVYEASQLEISVQELMDCLMP